MAAALHVPNETVQLLFLFIIHRRQFDVLDFPAFSCSHPNEFLHDGKRKDNLVHMVRVHPVDLACVILVRSPDTCDDLQRIAYAVPKIFLLSFMHSVVKKYRKGAAK